MDMEEELIFLSSTACTLFRAVPSSSLIIHRMGKYTKHLYKDQTTCKLGDCSGNNQISWDNRIEIITDR